MIEKRYLLALNVPLAARGGVYLADPLWAKDLLLHLSGIDDLTVLCPTLGRNAPSDWVDVSHSQIRVINVPPKGWLAPIRWVLKLRVLWREVKRADLVHTGLAGWPIPIGWLILPIAMIQRRFTIIVVESSFWRVDRGQGSSLAAKLKATMFEAINRFFVRRADIVFFTSLGYKETLGRDMRGRAHLLEATWIDEANLISPKPNRSLSRDPQAPFLYAGRLTDSKGVSLLIDAVLEAKIAVDFIGEGPLAGRLKLLEHSDGCRIRVLDPIPYGPAFFRLIDNYDALIVPTVSDEQPRVIFDAFARGLPVLASDTSGNKQVVTDGWNGILFDRNNARSLARCMTAASSGEIDLLLLGRNALQSASGKTHREMHLVRSRLVNEAFRSKSD